MSDPIRTGLIETDTGRLYTVYVHEPHDCVIDGMSANGYWRPQGSYDPDKIRGYEQGRFGPKIGYRVLVEDVGWFRDESHLIYWTLSASTCASTSLPRSGYDLQRMRRAAAVRVQRLRAMREVRVCVRRGERSQAGRRHRRRD